MELQDDVDPDFVALDCSQQQISSIDNVLVICEGTYMSYGCYRSLPRNSGNPDGEGLLSLFCRARGIDCSSNPPKEVWRYKRKPLESFASTSIIYDNIVYLTGVSHIYALNALSGAVLWKSYRLPKTSKDYPPTLLLPTLRGPSLLPLNQSTDGKLNQTSKEKGENTDDLIFVGYTGGVTAIKRSDGSKVWDKKLDLHGKFAPSLASYGFILYVALAGTIWALDGSDGSLIWEGNFGSRIRNMPCSICVTLQPSSFLRSSLRKSGTAMRPSSSTEEMAKTEDVPKVSKHSPTSSLSNCTPWVTIGYCGRVYTMHGTTGTLHGTASLGNSGFVSLLVHDTEQQQLFAAVPGCVYKLEVKSLEIIWKTKIPTEMGVVPSLTIFPMDGEDCLAVADGANPTSYIISALNIKTGNMLSTSWKICVKEVSSCSLVYQSGLLILGTSSGIVYAIIPNKADKKHRKAFKASYPNHRVSLSTANSGNSIHSAQPVLHGYSKYAKASVLKSE